LDWTFITRERSVLIMNSPVQDKVAIEWVSDGQH
jgi:hypothetical protein